MVGKVSDDIFYSVLKDLNRVEAGFKHLIEQFRKLSESSSLSEEEARKLEHVKERLFTIQQDISSITKSFPASGSNSMISAQGPPMIIRCKHWDDFKFHASNADTISFICKEDEKAFQVDAVKGGKVYTFSGEFPSSAAMLKAWLSKEIGVKESEILEGILALG